MINACLIGFPCLYGGYQGYCIYSKYWDTLTPYLICPIICRSLFHYLLMCLKSCWTRVANSVDPDQILHSMTSDLDPQCLLRTVCPSTLGYYGSK